MYEKCYSFCCTVCNPDKYRRLFVYKKCTQQECEAKRFIHILKLKDDPCRWRYDKEHLEVCKAFDRCWGKDEK